jgi:hypothetical protein
MVDAIKAAAHGSWRTTAAGLLGALALAAPQIAHAIDADPLTVCDWSIVLGALIVGLGLGAARDNRVSSEQAGAK